jgi:hypothetical protein
MTWWPGWDSVESASAWAHFWFWFGIGCFFLLGASEIVAFRYGLRKDALVEVRDQQRADQTKRDQEEAEERRAAEVGALQDTLSATIIKAEEDRQALLRVQQKQADRTLTAEQQRKIADKIRQSWHTVNVQAPPGIPEIGRIADGLIKAKQQAGWGVGVIVAAEVAPRPGIVIELPETASPFNEAGAQRLAAALRDENLAVTGPLPSSGIEALLNPDRSRAIPRAQMKVIVGVK